VRGRLSFRIFPTDFERQDTSPGFATQSSGTMNRPVSSFVSLDLLAIRTFVTIIFFYAHDLFTYSHAMYDAILPGAGGVNNLLMYSRIGTPADRWFARKIPVDTRLESMYFYLTTYLLVLMGKSFGSGFPKPEFLDISEVSRIVDWIVEMNRKGKACCITAAASNATRIARVAWEMGVSLKGTKFIAAGEPLTEGKQEIIERAGGTSISRYAYGGSLNIGFGCANPIHTDEIHVNQYMLALICHPRPRTEDGPPIYPLLCSTLHPAATRLLLNVESGDYATLHRRGCGCGLEKVGLNLHLHCIRSFEKFTSEGMNYFYGDLFELLEKTIPSEFGGGPGDYQLVEEEDEKGQTRLTLVVHPEVGQLDEDRLLSRLMEGLAQGSRVNRFMSKLWQDAGTFRIKREIPFASPRGKILPLHIRPVR